MTKKANTKAETSKQPKTIRVSTLAKAAVIVAALALSFAAGSYTTTHYKEVVKSEAKILVQDLKSAN